MILKRSPSRFKSKLVILSTLLLVVADKFILGQAHEAKDFDDTILYQIEFDNPKVEGTGNNSGTIREVYTQHREKYFCHIPNVDDKKEEKNGNDPELSPLALLQPIFATVSCSFRIEAYWSYEICHGNYVRQFHDEREGKNTKSQEFYLGKWTDEKTVQMNKEWDEERKAGIKYKHTKIDNIKYPYYEMEFNDGTMCEIINAPRKTLVRYVCYPHGKNEIYSFKEISSCHYEAIILTSVLCLIPAFHPEKTKELTIACSNPDRKTHKPINMLRQELNELIVPDTDLPIPKEAKDAAAVIMHYKTESGISYAELLKYKIYLDKMVLKLYQLSSQKPINNDPPRAVPDKPLKDYRTVLDFINGKNCLTGVTGWWKYEFCYGRYVRQFHKEKNSEVELFLGFFSEDNHKKWLLENPDKAPKKNGLSNHVWHHYGEGTRCDRTNQRREVDVKLTCVTNANSPTAVSMYLLEPKTCIYILVVDSPIICDMMQFTDEFGLLSPYSTIKQLVSKKSEEIDKDESPATTNFEGSGSTSSGTNSETKNSNANIDSSVESVDVVNVLV